MCVMDHSDNCISAEAQMKWIVDLCHILLKFPCIPKLEHHLYIGWNVLTRGKEQYSSNEENYK